jgi:hypothetical protein
MDEYPKWIQTDVAPIVVQTAAEEEAVLNKTVIVGLLTHSAGGDTYGITGYKPVKEKK